MAEEAQKVPEGKRESSFVKELSRSAAKHALAPLAATAATAGATYLTRKTTQIWQESVVPKLHEKGGGKAFAKDALEQAADKLGGRGSGLLLGLAKQLDERQPAAEPSTQQAEPTGSASADTQTQDPRRERERRERQQRRRQRQRALEQSGST